MNAFTRGLPLALLTTVAALAADVPSASDLPPILLPWNERAAPAHRASDAIARKPSSVSERTRQILNTKLIPTDVADVARTPRFAGALPGDPILGNATMMKPFFVDGLRLRPLEVERRDAPLWHFVKSGQFYRYVGRNVEFAGYFGLLSITSGGLAPRESTRLSISFTLSW